MKKFRWCDYGAVFFGIASGVVVGKYGKPFYDEMFPPRRLRKWEESCADPEDCECDVCDDDYGW